MNARFAIVGLAGRFPGAADIDQFWDNLVTGTESLTRLTDEGLRAAGISEWEIADPNHIRLLPLMDDVEGFDAKYFGYNPREAQVADPQQRIFVEVCHTALEHAGYDPRRYPGSIGVYGGAAPNTYGERAYKSPKAVAAVGGLGIEINNAADYVATRVAYALGLTGPAVSVMTACSTALVAVHLACQALERDECTMAIAGAVNVRVPYYKGHIWAEGGIYARDGHVRTFDARAAGTNFGYGAGAVILKHLDAAIADGDTVYAVVLGSAVNNDGADRGSFSAPGVPGQTAVVTQALRNAGVSPDSIGYVEAHGTGTAVGDPIEVTALSTAYRQAGGAANQSIPIGSVKTNIGHLGAAAGAPSLIKTVLAMRHQLIPASLHYEEPNPRIDFAETPFEVVATPRPWPSTGGPLRAGVSSFGIGGTNAHVIVEQAPEPEPTDPGRPWLVLPLSAKSPAALDGLRARLVEHLPAHPELDLADVAHTLQVGRQQLGHRTVAVCRNDPAAAARLTFGEPRQLRSVRSAPAAFLFPGQGSQHVDMAAEVYRTEPVFRAAVDECARLAEPFLGADLREVVFSSGRPSSPELAQRLQRTEFTQPALFTVEYALARLWQSWGVEPEAMVGHSVGEIVAACLAGVFTLPAAVEFVVTRGRLTQQMPTGSMLALGLSESDVESLLSDEISLAAVNGPRATVVSGPDEAIAALHDDLGRTGVQATVLQTSHAFHSWMLEPVVGPLREAAERAGLGVPTRRFVSTVTGDWITDKQATDPDYWAEQVRRPVQFAQAVQTVAESGAILLEVGPGRALTSMARQTLGKSAWTVTSLPRAGQASSESDGEALARAVGELWAYGFPIDWAALAPGRRRRVALPAYPYERTRFWLDEADLAPAPASAVEEPAATGVVYVPTWRQRRLAPTAPGEVATGPLLVFTPGSGPVEQVALTLARHGRTVVRVVAGDGFAELGPDRFQVAPAAPGDYEQLVRALDAGVGQPTTILHGWTVTPAAADPLAPAAVDAVRERGFYSLLHLTQAMVTRWPAGAVALRVVTTFAADVTGTDALEPAKSLLRGPVQVVPIEYNQVETQLVDITPDTGAEHLIDELAAAPADQLVAYRGGRRWVGEYELSAALDHPVAVPSGLRRRGVYLVTGGLGGLGRLVAKELALLVGARLVLTGRTALPDRGSWDEHLANHPDARASRAIQAVREIEALGSEVMPLCADVSDEDAMRAAIETARDRFGRIDGVFHAAGVAGGGIIALKTRDGAESVLRSKVDGTLLLHRLLGDDVDLFVLFSSILGITGGYGQVDYGAANAFQDAFAQSRAGGRVQVLSTAWCGWDGIGMTTDGVPTRARDDYSSRPFGAKGPGLLGRRLLDGDELVYVATIGPDWHWALAEHRMDGRPVFPGTSYAEMFAAAAREVFGQEVELRDLIFSQPLAVDAPRELRVMGVRQASGAYQFSVTSRPAGQSDAPWDRHATATAAAHVEPAPPKHDVSAIAARCPDQVQLGPVTGTDGIVVFGPHWQVVQSLALGTGENLARLELPAGLDGDVADYLLHPSLLDGATALSLHLADTVYLPIAYDRIVVREALPARFHSYVRSRGGAGTSGIRSFDIALIDDDGRELVTIEGFSVRVVDPTAIHSGLDRPADPAARTSALLSLGELMLDPVQGMDLLWRMLDTQREPHYVVSLEPLGARRQRLAGIASQLAGAVAAGRGAGLAGRATPRVVGAKGAEAEPATPTEKLLLPLWEDAFGISELGPDEDFFELGGNSLVAVQLAVRMREQFGVNVPGVAVLEFPTVRTLAQHLDETRAETNDS